MTIAKPLAQSIVQSLAQPLTGCPSSGAAWTPASLSDVMEWWLSGSGGNYHSGLLDGRHVLDSKQSYGSHRAPRAGRCWNFSGGSGYAKTASAVSSTGSQATICFWVKTSDSTWATFGPAATYWFYFESSTIYTRAGVNSGAIESIAYTQSSSATHFALVRDGTSVEIYVNGSSIGSLSDVSWTGVSSFEYLGCREPGVGHLNGKIWDHRFYDTNKSSAEISAIYAGDYDDPDESDIIAGYWGNEESDGDGFDWSGNGHDVTFTNETLSSLHATDTDITGNPANRIGHTNDGGIIIPRSAANHAEDTQGSALELTGETPYPVVVETPCLTLSGLNEYVNCGNDSSVKVSGAFSIEIVFKANSLSNTPGLVAHGQGYTGTAANAAWGVSLDAADGQVRVTLSDGTTANTHGMTATVDADEWVHLVVTWDGTTDTGKIICYLNGSQAGVATSNVTSINPTPSVENHLKFGNRYYSTGSFGLNGQIALARLWKSELSSANVSYLYDPSTGSAPSTPAGHWSFQDGPGSSNTNRTIHNAVANANHGSVVGGTVSSQWANRCPGYARDHCIEYGGSTAAGGEFVPALLDGSSDADGNSIEYAAGNALNPYSRENMNYWTAAEYNGRSVPTAHAPGDDLNGTVTPSDSAFARSSATQEDRRLITRAALTGSDKTNAEAYVA